MDLTKLIQTAHQRVRDHVNALPPAERSQLCRDADVQQTHYYAWLRGEDRKLSNEAVSRVMRVAGIGMHLRTVRQEVYRPGVTKSMNYDLPNGVLNEIWGVVNAASYRFRVGAGKSRWSHRSAEDDPEFAAAIEVERKKAEQFRRPRR